MLTLLHGENIVASRQVLRSMIDTAQEAQAHVTQLDQKTTTLGSVQQALHQDDFFGQSNLLVIENLHAGPTSVQRKQIIAEVVDAEQDIILWEQKKLTATQLKKFPQAKQQVFNLSKFVFSWLETLGAQNNEAKGLKLLHQAVAQESSELCFFLLIRQVRLLLQAKDGETLAVAPFQKSRFISQSQRFTLRQLLALHQSLLQTDLAIKSSQLLLPLQLVLEDITLRRYTKKMSYVV